MSHSPDATHHDVYSTLATRKTMFTSLPAKIQASVREYLAMDNFVEAKRLYDSWVLQSKTHQHHADKSNAVKKQPTQN